MKLKKKLIIIKINYLEEHHAGDQPNMMVRTTGCHKHATRTERSAQHLSLTRSDFLIEFVRSRTVRRNNKVLNMYGTVIKKWLTRTLVSGLVL